MSQYIFGPGSLYGTNTNALSTPRRFAGLQDVSVDYAFTEKELFGSYQYPISIARGTGKITCKAKAATIEAGIYNDLFFGQTEALTLVNASAVDENQPIGSTVTSTHSATWTTDLGVQWATGASAGQWLTLVSGSPTITGTYSVSAGIYSFCAADVSAGYAIRLNYVYTVSTGGIITLNNQLIGTTPLFSAVFTTIFNSQQATFTFTQCTSSKLNFNGKITDYTIPEFDFQCFANSAGVIGTLSFSAA